MLCGSFLPSRPGGLIDDDRARLWPGAQAGDALFSGTPSRPIVASVSGGKDSAAMALWMLEQGLEFEPVFVDTGWEHAATYEYLDGPLTAALGRITWLRAERRMAALIRHKAMFPSHRRRFCTAELKLRPFEQHLLRRYPEGDAINAVGIRAAESRARAGLPRWSNEDGMLSFIDTWRPLIDWDEQRVRAMHRRHGLPLNPLYSRGAARVGCWPCIYARRGEIRQLAGDRQRVEQISKLEREVDRMARERGADRGSTFFFSAARGPMPIQQAIRWARADTRQTATTAPDELFDPGEGRRGCMRFGLCDFPADDSSPPSRALPAPALDSLDSPERPSDERADDALHRLAHEALLLDDLPRARALQQRLLGRLPEQAHAARAVLEANQAHVLARLGLDDESGALADRCRSRLDRVADAPARARLANQLAWTLLKLPDRGAEHDARARQLADQAVELVAERYRPAVLDTRARLHLAAGRTEEAELDARRAHQVTPDHPALRDLFRTLIDGAPRPLSAEKPVAETSPPLADGGLEPIGY